MSVNTPETKSPPSRRNGRLDGWGKLKNLQTAIDEAFTPELEEQIAQSLDGQDRVPIQRA